MRLALWIGGTLSLSIAVYSLMNDAQFIEIIRLHFESFCQNYDSSRRATKLAMRLRVAGIDCSASRWRCFQMAAWIMLTIFCYILDFSGIGTLLALLSLVSWSSKISLRVRKGTLDHKLEKVAIGLARYLATETASGYHAATAIDKCGLAVKDMEDKSVAWILNATRAGMNLGQEVSNALTKACQQISWGSNYGGRILLLVAKGFALQTNRGVSSENALLRIANVLEEASQRQAHLKSVTTEARWAAYAIPFVAAGILVLICTSQPAALVAITTPIGLLILSICVAIASWGLWWISWATRLT